MRTLVKVLGALCAAAALGLGVALGTSWPREARGVPAQPRDDRSATSGDLDLLATKRIYFAHQSVGDNILGGVPEVYAKAGVSAPRITDIDTGGLDPSKSGSIPVGTIVHSHIGVNGDPLGKLDAFAAQLRGGLGEQIDVAILKFCYVDINAETDLHALFERYRATLAELGKEFPAVVFVPATAPLTTEDGARQAAKNLLGRTSDNIAREKYNALVRAEYASSGYLFDPAGVESTEPDGTRVSRSAGGQVHFALYAGYAADEGHLNAEGARRVAGEFLAAAAQATSTR